MKKNILLVFLLIIGLLASCNKEDKTIDKKTNEEVKASSQSEKDHVSEEAYLENIKSFEKVSMKDINSKKDSENFYLYMGRETCPYCRDISAVLKEIKEEKNLKIYYIDTSEDDEELDKFIKDTSLEYIPAFYSNKDGVLNKLEVNSPYLKEDILKLIENN